MFLPCFLLGRCSQWFDMDAIRSYREQEMMGNTFRKVNAYGLLLSEKIEYPFIRDNQAAAEHKQ